MLWGFALPQALADVNITFSWQAPTQRENGSSVTTSEIAKFTIYDGDTIIAELPNTTGTHTIVVTEGLTALYSMTATDSLGLESKRSNTVEVELSPLEAVNLNVEVISNTDT